MLPASVHSNFHLLFNQCRTGCGNNTESENIDSKTPNQKTSTQKHRIKNTESITPNHKHRSRSNVNKYQIKLNKIELIVEKIPKKSL